MLFRSGSFYRNLDVWVFAGGLRGVPEMMMPGRPFHVYGRLLSDVGLHPHRYGLAD